MFKKNLNLILIIVVAVGTLIGIIISLRVEGPEPPMERSSAEEVAGIFPWYTPSTHKLELNSNGEVLGAVPFRPSFFKTRLARSLAEGSDSTTIYFTSLTTADGYVLTMADVGDRVSFILNPNSSSGREIISCTGLDTSALSATGCSRGFNFYNSATTTARMVGHTAGETVIISNDDLFLNAQYVNMDGAQTITGLKTFSNYPVYSDASVYATSSAQFITKAYADNIALAGAATSTESVTGIVRLATQVQMASSSYDALIPTALYSRYSTSSPYTTGLWIPISQNNGQLSSSWFTQGSASTSFYGITAPSHNLNNIGWYTNAFRDIFSSGTIYANNINFAGTLTGSINLNSSSTSYIDQVITFATSTTGVYGYYHQPLTGAASDDKTFTFPIAGNLLGVNSSIRVHVNGSTTDPGADDNLTVAVNFGGTDFGSWTFRSGCKVANPASGCVGGVVPVAESSLFFQADVLISNRNAKNIQIGNGMLVRSNLGGITTTTPYQASQTAIDTTTSQNLDITLTTSGNNFYGLEDLTVEILNAR